MGDPNMGAWILKFLRARSDRDHRVSRQTLIHACRLAGFPEADDRMVRRAIEEMRQGDPEGPCIVSSSQAPGYFFCTDLEDLELANAEELSRIEATRAKVANRQRTIERLKALPLGQVEMPL